ncbi:MAG: helix-turn-helix transcriptional regulator [Christensenellales bacterium]
MPGSALHHLQELVLDCFNLWSWQYDESFRLMGSNCPGESATHSLSPAHTEQIRSFASLGLLPAVLVWGKIAWAVAREEGVAAIYHVFGPARSSEQEGSDGFSGEKAPDFADALPTMSLQELGRYASMLHRAANGSAASVHTPGEISGLMGSPSSALLLGRLQDKIRNGDMQFKDLALEVLTDPRLLHSLGAVTTDSAKRIALLSVDLCCKAAIEGGLAPKTASAIRDEYLPKIHATDIAHEIAFLCNLLMYHLVRLVRRSKGISTFSGPVQSACTYIEEHVCDRLTIRLLAKQIGYSPDHLARKFKDEVGEAPKEYIMRAKIRCAQLMLTTTDIPIGDVAGMLSFCSSSHFARVFHDIAGRTPSDYRTRHTHIA